LGVKLRVQSRALGVIDKTQWNSSGSPASRSYEWSEADRPGSARSIRSPHRGRKTEKLESAPWEVRSKGYDLVLNGYETRLRQHSNSSPGHSGAPFKALGLSEEQLRRRFAFSWTRSPSHAAHGGIALEIDRVVMLLRRRNFHPRSHRFRRKHPRPRI